MPTEKRSTTYRLSEEARGLLEELARHHGIAQTAVLEMAIRELARRDVPHFHPMTSDPSAPEKKKRKSAK